MTTPMVATMTWWWSLSANRNKNTSNGAKCRWRGTGACGKKREVVRPTSYLFTCLGYDTWTEDSGLRLKKDTSINQLVYNLHSSIGVNFFKNKRLAIQTVPDKHWQVAAKQDSPIQIPTPLSRQLNPLPLSAERMIRNTLNRYHPLWGYKKTMTGHSIGKKRTWGRLLKVMNIWAVNTKHFLHSNLVNSATAMVWPTPSASATDEPSDSGLFWRLASIRKINSRAREGNIHCAVTLDTIGWQNYHGTRPGNSAREFENFDTTK